jgi:hypothetical protein
MDWTPGFEETPEMVPRVLLIQERCFKAAQFVSFPVTETLAMEDFGLAARTKIWSLRSDSMAMQKCSFIAR